MHRSATVSASLVVAAMSFGCAHTGANQYAYAPPLAPPVYPQPQTVAQPALTAAPGPVVGAPALPAPPVVTGVPVSAAGGVIPASADGSCPPCAGASGAVPVSYEAGAQTTPCPPGP